MKKREVKEIEKEKEKSRIERENRFKKPKKEKRERKKKWESLLLGRLGQHTRGSTPSAARHTMHVREGQGAEITSKCDSTQWNSDGDDVRDQRSAKATNDYTRKAQKDNFQLPACLLVRPHWPLRTFCGLWWRVQIPPGALISWLLGVCADHIQRLKNLLYLPEFN